MTRLSVLDGGMLTSLQDRGRTGYQQYGVAVAGCMDFQAMEIANLLVGNRADEAVLEMTVNGGSYRAQGGDLVIAVFGADMPIMANGRSISGGRAFLLKDGQELSIGNAKAGLRAYMAVRGGFKAPEVMGSKSTYLQGKIGGFEGRKIQKGDILEVAGKADPEVLYSLPEDYIDKYYEGLRANSHEVEIRVIGGPQEEAFTEEGLQVFYSSTYKITNNSNRMGYRLEGRKIDHKKGADIISDGIMFGSIQVPGDGLPLIMMADHQTTGGYTKIAGVITPDLIKLAQLGPGAKIKFKKIGYDRGLEAYRSWRRGLDKIKDIFEDVDFKNDQAALKRDGDMEKNLQEVEKLIRAFENLDLKKLDIKDGDFRLCLERGDSSDRPKVSNPKVEEQSLIEPEPTGPDLYEVKAPISGMCYRAPGQGEPAFVEKGDRVKKGQTLMILEVMKMMNEITAQVDGVIEEVLFENEQKVEAGDLLFTLRQ